MEPVVPPTAVTEGPAEAWPCDERPVPKFLYYLRVKKRRTGCGEGGEEPDFPGAVFAVPSTDAAVSTCDENADSTGAELCNLIAHTLCMLSRVDIFSSPFRNEDRLWDNLRVDHVFEPGKEPVCTARRPGADNIGDVRGRVRHSLSVLHLGARHQTKLEHWPLIRILIRVEYFHGEVHLLPYGTIGAQEPV